MTRESDRIAKLNEPIVRDILCRTDAAHLAVPHNASIDNSHNCDELYDQLSIDAGLDDPPENVIDGEVLPNA